MAARVQITEQTLRRLRVQASSAISAARLANVPP